MTLIIVALFIGGLIAWDVYTMLKNGSDSTISWQVYTLSQKYPAIAFAIGFVMGHMFWVQHGG